jgi:hypothetical protein
VQFVGRLDAATQAAWYDRATVVPVAAGQRLGGGVGAGGHGARLLPLLSDLPANRELVRTATTA